MQFQIGQQLRISIKNRDGNKCQICEISEYLIVHHKTPLRFGGSDDPNNLITLCHSCHVGVEYLSIGHTLESHLKSLNKTHQWFFDKVKSLELITNTPFQIVKKTHWRKN